VEIAQRGDTILEPGANPRADVKQIKITKVEVAACASRGTHINDAMCYDAHAEVYLKVASPT